MNNVLQKIKIKKETTPIVIDGNNNDNSKFKFDRYWLFFPISIIYMELIVKLMIYKSFFDTGLIYVPLFSVAACIIFTLICTSSNDKVNRKLTLILSFILGIYFSFEGIYYNTMKSFFTFATLGMAGDATEFWRETLFVIAKNSYVIVLMLLPYLFYKMYGKKIPAKQITWKLRGFAVSAMIIAHLLAVLIISFNTGDYSDNYYYRSVLSPSDTVSRFGILTTSRMDLQQIIFGAPKDKINKHYNQDDVEDVLSNGAGTTETTTEAQTTTGSGKTDYGYNMMNIDFDKLMKNETNQEIIDMDKYFSNVTPSKKNEYTGTFKGKNLIFLTLEGFSGKVIDPKLTPTLYKMSTQGFVFNNFYTSLWGGSTATGEYSNCTGNFYTTSNCLRLSSANYLPFCLGNQFKKIDYSTFAYHNNTYTYYGRNLSHPNMGYTYKAIGNGLNGLTDSWPRSDNEMANISIKDYIGKTPFHVYYMTVSGHGNYSWSANSMSTKHKAEVQNLPYSENLKAYVACNLEVEDMLNSLIKQLDEAGILDDTVFAMTPDHYPYLLDDSDLADLYNLNENEISNNFDLYKNSFILWSSSMDKPVVVDKPCSSIDIVPTLSNLFGLEYDSRLMMGTDILSDSDPVVLLNCMGSGGSWHWITSYGSYNTKTKIFTANKDANLDKDKQDEYVSMMNNIVQQKRSYSKKILDLDYYKYVFSKKDG